MNIGIIGSGIVGQQLGLGFLRLGHKVMIGTRDPGKLKEWKDNAGEDASVGSFREAAAFGDIIVLCTFWAGTENAVKMAGNENFSNKLVIDVTNPLDFTKGVPPLLVSQPGKSGGETIQGWLPDSKVVKAFNIVNAYIMVKPELQEGKADMFIAGNDGDAKKKVIEIAEGWGWKDVIDMGDISMSYWLETFAMMWIHYGFKNKSWGHAFKLLKK